MADFRGTILTQKGRNLLAKAQTGTTLTFTKIAIGDGLWPSNTDPTQLNDLVSPKLNLPIQEIKVVGDGTVRLRFVLTNTGLSQGFFMREIGIYAQDPDIGEILYAVAYAGDRADFIPADGITKVENVVDIYTVIANAQNITAVISDTVVIATKQDINTVKPEASSTAPDLTYPGKLWVDSNRFLKYHNGSNWQDLKVSFADTVDGLHASQTPGPNVILPLNADGILDLSATYMKSNVYTFRRVDLANATSDYELKVGEEAIINFTNATSVPLRIATGSGRLYEIFLQFSVNLNLNFTFLYPNNTSYASSFSHTSYYWNSGTGAQSSWVGYTTVADAFNLFSFTPHSYIILETTRRTLKGFVSYEFGDMHVGYGIFASKWHSNLATWTSLGTFIFPTSMSGYILVRRLA
jgi:hypothetical protein